MGKEDYVYTGLPSSFLFLESVRWERIPELKEAVCKLLFDMYKAGKDELCRVETYNRILPPEEKGGEPIVVEWRILNPFASGWALKTTKEHDCEWARNIPLPDCMMDFRAMVMEMRDRGRKY